MNSLNNNEAALEASRHLCQEARVVLTSLRGGPPNVARGDLAQDLMDLRGLIKYTIASTDDATTAAAKDDGDSVSSAFEGSTSTAATTPADDLTSGLEPPSASSTTNNSNSNQTSLTTTSAVGPQVPAGDEEDVRPFARPFLAVVMDPRAAGPHTLVALRSLHRLLERRSLIPVSWVDHMFKVSLEGLMKGILNCKFEQTDAGADEAVEMAIADLLALIVKLDRRSIQSETLMDAFNTVFVTRNTFVHSPALCYHFEDVLTTMIKAVFGDLVDLWDQSGRLIFEFLVNQLLHTPLVGGEDEASREAQLAHDATRVLCLRLARTALRTGFPLFDDETLMKEGTATSQQKERNLLHVVQDDLCLSLLMTGQAIWAFQDNENISPGFISLEVLSEICSTLSTLWTNASLRKHLVPQFESIFTGFYQRALVLLRKRTNPIDSLSFHTNLVFDAGVEVILESLVDIMCLHDHQQTVAEGNGGTLESLFATYDCNMKRSDVAVGLMIELCGCTGSRVDEDGDILNTALPSEINSPRSSLPPPTSVPGGVENYDDDKDLVSMSDACRQVPPHLKELCAEAVIGGMKCLFRDDHPSEKTLAERQNRESIMAGHVPPAPQSFSDLNRVTSVHHLRNLKSQKRLMRRAAQLFNKKSSKGIQYLVESGIITEPVAPRSVASFLRNGIVVGLDKKAVGAYLGEVGKSPQPGKSPPDWERDWFHKEVLETFCSLFRFENQSLLDGLRMFLAAFRLPGEAQQIDRILQAFSDSCSRLCDEACDGPSKLFSAEQKRASDAAYLLSFSIIMLNTDQHNDNIREDRKMTKRDFIKNNTDYGSDITEPGKEFPAEYLGGIYDSIREEEIRTEGEGADGSMTVERWKDVLRGSVDEEEHSKELPTPNDAEDLTELVLEHVWMPIMSAISALWGTNPPMGYITASGVPAETGTGGMLGAQGSRLGMDMAWEMLGGVRKLGRNDLFRKIFNCVCKFSGLLEYTSNAADRTWRFANSVEAQSAFIIALRTAHDAHSELGIEGWKRIWLMLFELRDLKMFGGGVSRQRKSVLAESDPDLLKEDARRDWTMKIIKRGKNDESAKESSGYSMFGAVGRALFGSVEDPTIAEATSPTVEIRHTVHGKEEHLVWDEVAPSDDENEANDSTDDESKRSFGFNAETRLSPGSHFENLLIQEDLIIKQQREMPVTGLERVDDTEANRPSPRRRVRKRLLKCCDFPGLISESRFMDDEGLTTLIDSLLCLVPAATIVSSTTSPEETGASTISDFSSTTESFPQNPISPASAAFAEVLLCELALRNRDRLTVLWHNHLKPHYALCLLRLSNTFTTDEKEHMKIMNGAIEKSITGLLRISCCAVQRGEIANDVLDTWKVLDQVQVGGESKCLLNSLDRHLAEGLWRTTRVIDVETQLDDRGWEGLMSLSRWCASRGRELPPVRSNGIGRPVGLAEDDPALQAYRSLHFLLNVSENKDFLPPSMVECVHTLIETGDKRGCPKLSIAGLDLLYVLSARMESQAMENPEADDNMRDDFWVNRWRPVLESMAEASKTSTHSVSVVDNIHKCCETMSNPSFFHRMSGSTRFQC